MLQQQRQLQYFEMLGNRGIWSKGWKAVTFHGREPWENKAKWRFPRRQMGLQCRGRFFRIQRLG